MGADFSKELSSIPGGFGSKLKIRSDNCPKPLDLRSRKPFKMALNHQKGFQRSLIVVPHDCGKGART